MHSMLDQVREAEEQAAAIRQDAVQAGRERIAQIQQQLKEQRLQEAQTERAGIKAAMDAAEKEGEALAKDIVAERQKQTDLACAQAEQKLPEAVSYLLRRVVTDA